MQAANGASLFACSVEQRMSLTDSECAGSPGKKLADCRGIWWNTTAVYVGSLRLTHQGGTLMSRVTTPSQAQPKSIQPDRIPHDKIAMRAYEKWVKRGRPQGTEMQDWIEAENELRAELTGTSGHGKR
jgi:hypothetical protein